MDYEVFILTRIREDRDATGSTTAGITSAMFAVIAAKLPGRTAQEAILTGRRYGGPDAAAAGIVHEVAGDDQVLARAVQLAAGLATKERRTLAEHKRLRYGEAIKSCGG